MPISIAPGWRALNCGFSLAMEIDAQTLRELQIFEASGQTRQSRPLFELFEYCLTTGGARRLRARFEQPLQSLTEIQAVQDSLRFLLQEKEGWMPALSGRQERVIENYFFSGLETVRSPLPPLAWAQGLKHSLWYRSFREIEGGVRETLAFLRDLYTLWQRQQARDKPGLLQRIWRELDELFADQQLQLWLRRGGDLSFTRLFLCDRFLREDFFREVKHLMRLVFELDALHAMARAMRELKLVFPVFVDAERPLLEVEGLFHPKLQAPVANDLALGAEQHLLFLTGPNMAGKTTFLRACALAVYLAHLGLGVPAKAMRLTRCEGLLTSLQNEDNLELGHSYFYAEVLRVRQAAELIQKHRRVLVIFDELFRGTNYCDALDGTREVVKGLAGLRQTLFILSSHLFELVADLETLPGLQFSHFSAELKQGQFHFSYRLEAGVSQNRIGLEILRQEKILELLAAAAQA